MYMYTYIYIYIALNNNRTSEPILEIIYECMILEMIDLKGSQSIQQGPHS